MITILDTYTQISFEDVRNIYKYLGTYNKKENNIIAINITIYKTEGNVYQGNMTYSKDSGVTISTDENVDTVDLDKHVDVFMEIKKEIETILIPNVL